MSKSMKFRKTWQLLAVKKLAKIGLEDEMGKTDKMM
jgi:hypothetical protein